MIFQRSCVQRNISLFLLSAVSLFLMSCGSTKADISPVTPEIVERQTRQIKLVFAGDIMAHTINFKAGNFKRIWEDITPVIKQGDLAFANIEAPVNDAVEWSTYPQFNMHSSYIQAAVDAGFNVFSLSNNHTNDWYLDGINATRDYFNSRNDIWACGLRKKSNDDLTYRIIEKNGIKVLFVAVTEILNRPDYGSWIDYYPQKKHQLLVEQLKDLKNKEEHDIFVFSIHTDEEEYKTKVTESHRKFYNQLIEECGVDIVWANHPHVSKEFEKINILTDEGIKRQAFIMYANGNTISGQRYAPSISKEHVERDDTGDGLIFVMNISVEKGCSPVFNSIEPFFITTYIQPNGQLVVRLGDQDFVHSLKRSGLFGWSEFIEKRINIFENLKGQSKWQ